MPHHPPGHLGSPARFHPSRPLFSTPDPAASPAHPLREAPSIFPRRSHSLVPPYPFWGSPPSGSPSRLGFPLLCIPLPGSGLRPAGGASRMPTEHPRFRLPPPPSSRTGGPPGRGPDPSALQVRAPRLPTVAIPIRPLALGVGVQRVPNIEALTLRPDSGSSTSRSRTPLWARVPGLP